MRLADSLFEACQIVRQGGQLLPEACEALQAAVDARGVWLFRQLDAAALPLGLDNLRQLVQEALSDCSDAVGALSVACQEDSPEFAGWALEKAQCADETMRRVRQLLEEYSAMLCEEGAGGDS